MSLYAKLPLLFGFMVLTTYASTILFVGPNFPVPNTAKFGLPCTLADIGCILGDPLAFEVFSASITQPTVSNPNWVLQIQTNYGNENSTPLIPGSPDVVPNYFNTQVGGTFGIGDAIFTWNGNIYGVVLHPHDGYLAGDLYQAFGYQTSAQVEALGPHNAILNPNGNAWIAAGGSLIGAGTLTGGQTGDGITAARYTLTDQFSAPSNFLATGTTFGFYFTSYACANSVIVGSGGFTGGGGGVPEPGTFFLCVPALLLLGFRLARQRGPQGSQNVDRV